MPASSQHDASPEIDDAFHQIGEARPEHLAKLVERNGLFVAQAFRPARPAYGSPEGLRYVGGPDISSELRLKRASTADMDVLELAHRERRAGQTQGAAPAIARAGKRLSRAHVSVP
jgi:hypothetical protein